MSDTFKPKTFPIEIRVPVPIHFKKFLDKEYGTIININTHDIISSVIDLLKIKLDSNTKPDILGIQVVFQRQVSNNQYYYFIPNFQYPIVNQVILHVFKSKINYALEFLRKKGMSLDQAIEQTMGFYTIKEEDWSYDNIRRMYYNQTKSFQSLTYATGH